MSQHRLQPDTKQLKIKKDKGDWVRTCLDYAAEDTQPKKTWKEAVDSYSKCFNLRASDALEQKWRKLVRDKQSHSSDETGDSGWCLFLTDLVLAHMGWPSTPGLTQLTRVDLQEWPLNEFVAGFLFSLWMLNYNKQNII